MRDNGLNAASYEAAGEVDPRLADTVLTSLAAAGIAAYTKPSVGRDQLYVDATETGRAREIVRRTTDDVIFAELVASLGADETGERPWPAAEDLDRPTDRHRRRAADGSSDTPAETGASPDTEETTPIDVSAEIAAADAAEAERVRREAERDPEQDHFVPPEPAPAPKLDWISKLAWTGLIGGPAILVLAAVFDIGRGGRLLAIALLAFVAGFFTLVLRMKDRPPIDDTPDDGAVV